MGNPDKSTVINKIKEAEYASDFETVFGTGSLENIDSAFEQVSEAVAAFERTRIFSPFTSKWDAEMADGELDGDVFNESELRGFEAFKAGRCDDCHFTPPELLGAQFFTNFEYKNIGVPKNPTNPLLLENPDFIDFGAGSAPDDPESGPHSVIPPGSDAGKYKVPTLRNIAETAPYMHNGVFTTLEQVIDFYNADFVVTAEFGNTITDGGLYFRNLFLMNPEQQQSR